MKVALFIPCYVDQFYPQVGKATLRLLEKFGCDVEYPADQTCCGQPPANSGMEREALPIYRHFIETFHPYDYIIAPSGSCVYHVRHHYDVLDQSDEVQKIRKHTLDICTFLLEVLKIDHLNARFPYKVGIHQSCHGLRGLRMAKSSELIIPAFSQWQTLLEMVDDIELIELNRPDECCGFGGTFAVKEEPVSVKMGQDRIRDHEKNGAEVITSGDMSCLMHMEGILKRENSPIRVKHIVEILAGEMDS
jgi:L-lactate dehydrogenase complex protein LldE